MIAAVWAYWYWGAMDPREVVTYSVLCFVSIFAVVNPFRASTAMAMISETWTPKQRAVAVNRALLVAGAILFLAAWIGNHIIIRSQINMGGFRIASGLLLLATVIPSMVRNRPLDQQFGKYLGANAENALAIGITPIAIPLLANAPSLATVTLYSGEPHELWRRLANLAALLVTLVIAYFMMRFAPRVHGLFGERGSRFVTHVLHLTVASWAVDFTAVGVRDLLPLITSTPPALGG